MATAQLPFFNPINDDTTHEWPEDEIAGDPHKGSSTWLQKRPEIQQARDKTLRRISQGGIFVPAMTTPDAEPKYAVYNTQNILIKENTTAATTYVPPGDYVVYVGTGTKESQLAFDVHVVENEITYIPAEWSALLVKVVDAKGIAFRGNYEILNLEDRGYIGLGVGASLADAEELDTWLLWPGKYMIISVGEDYRAKKNFITVNLDPGKFTYITLVLDEENGNILGGGEIDSGLPNLKSQLWHLELVTGGAISFNHSRNIVSKIDDEILDLSAFVQTLFSIFIKNHYIYTRLNAEIGGKISFRNKYFVSSTDELNLEFLYTYKVTPWFGPYFRASFVSNMAPSIQELDEPYTIIKMNKNNEIAHTSAEPDIKLDLGPPFSPIVLNTGTGARFDTSVGNWMRFNARIGLAYRVLFARDLYIIRSHNYKTQTVTLAQLSNSRQFGIEMAAYFEILPLSWLSLKLETAMLEPFNDHKAPIIELKTNATIRLSNIASLVYTLKLDYEKRVTEKPQIDQLLQLRFSYKFF